MSPDLRLFLDLMDGEWVVERFGLDARDQLTVYYVSCLNPMITFSHQPAAAYFCMVPKVGTVGRLGFTSNATHEWLRSQAEP